MSKRLRMVKICEGCGNEFYFQSFECEYDKRKYCSRECANEHTAESNSQSKLKENNPNWKHGLYSGYIRAQVPKKCEECGEGKKEILIHHIDGNRKNNLLTNLRALCRSCHYYAHNKIYDKNERRKCATDVK